MYTGREQKLNLKSCYQDLMGWEPKHQIFSSGDTVTHQYTHILQSYVNKCLKDGHITNEIMWHNQTVRLAVEQLPGFGTMSSAPQQAAGCLLLGALITVLSSLPSSPNCLHSSAFSDHLPTLSSISSYVTPFQLPRVIFSHASIFFLYFHWDSKNVNSHFVSQLLHWE